MYARIPLGLASALVLLAACGPSKPTSDAGEGAEDGPDDDGVETQASAESDTGPAVAMCTFENYADDPQLLEFTELGCVPVEADGTCAVCDLACMESIVNDCPINSCGIPDLPCISECGSHLLLCSEQLGDQCCHLVTAEYTGGVPGRPLRHEGAALLPTLTLMGPATCDVAEQAEAAAAYREFARYERASVDAFLHAAVVLEQLGAPSWLVEAQREAGREEAEHARLALAAARSIDGREATLEPPDPPATRGGLVLEDFVRDLIHDGCVGELIAAREAAWALAEVGECPALHDYWRPVASEEHGHAALAWSTLEWLLGRHPELEALVVAELAAAIAPRQAPARFAAPARGLASSSVRTSLRAHAIAALVDDAQRVTRPQA